jgi:hypothetical protein
VDTLIRPEIDDGQESVKVRTQARAEISQPGKIYQVLIALYFYRGVACVANQPCLL